MRQQRLQKTIPDFALDKPEDAILDQKIGNANRDDIQTVVLPTQEEETEQKSE